MNNNRKKTLKVIAAAALMFSCSVALSTLLNVPTNTVYATESAPISNAGSFDFSGERDVNEYYLAEHEMKRVLSTNVMQGTTTETSAAFNFSLRTLVSTGYQPGNKSYAFLIEDENFVGDATGIASEQHDEYEYVEKEVAEGNGMGEIGSKKSDDDIEEGYQQYAVLDGSVIYFSLSDIKTNNSTKQKYINMYVPSYVRGRSSKEKNRFLTRINTIRENAITKEGTYYSTPTPKPGDLSINTWDKLIKANADVSDPKELVTCYFYIPEEVISCDYGAFKDVPDNVVFRFESETLPLGFDDEWAITANGKPVTCEFNCDEDRTDPADSEKTIKAFNFDTYRVQAGQANKVELSEPVDIILGFYNDDLNHKDEKYNKPLTLEYQITDKNGAKRTEYLNVPRNSNANVNYDSVGKISKSNYECEVNIEIKPGEVVDPTSFIFHNVFEAIKVEGVDKEGKTISVYSIDTTKPLYTAANKIFENTVDFSQVLSYEKESIHRFLDYTVFAFSTDLVLDNVSAKYTEPHSLYLDVKTNSYEQNLSGILSGKTRIRYCLYNLYKTSYTFEYYGENNQLKTVTVPVDTAISYQELNNEKNNKVSLILQNSDIGADFKAENLIRMTISNLIVQMDLLTITSTNSTAKLAKSEISYRFGNIVVFNKDTNTVPSVFDYNIFLLIFFLCYIVVYALCATGTYFICKEKFKNDEFRRVNTKKFVQKAALGLGGLAIVLGANLSIVMRTTGFNNTIVAFNPTDPFVIALSIFGAIVIGYFIVMVVKTIKTETERKKILRLKLNEDKDEDGTN